MSEAATFACDACGRKIPWRKEIAGKQGKCKCGQLLLVPTEFAPADDALMDLSELAADAERAAAELPPTIVEVAAPPPPPRAPKTPAAKAAGGSRAPILPKAGRDADEVFLDKNRDLIVPMILALAGAALMLGYYAMKLDLGPSRLAGAGVGLSIIIAIEAALLIGFALIVAGPLGVSFGDFRTAWYKFAAIAVFCDGVSLWVDNWITKISGGFGGGALGFGVIGLPIALLIYWTTMIYLFNMDAGDAKTVVAVLCVFYRIARLILIFVLLRPLLAMGGVTNSALLIPAAAQPANSQRDRVEEAQNLGLLMEARAYATKWRDAEVPTVNAWYDAGAKNVWYQLSRDINGHGYAHQFVIELPKDSAARAKCHDIATDWYRHLKMMSDDQSVRDRGDPFLIVELP